MDTFFNIGGWEILVILIIAGIVMGPKRIRDIAYWLGKMTTQMRQISQGFMRQLNAELDAVDSGEMRAAMQDVKDLQRQIQELRQEVTGVAIGTLNSGQDALREGRDMVENSIAPPSPAADKPPTAKPAAPVVTSNGSSNGLPKPIEVPDDPE